MNFKLLSSPLEFPIVLKPCSFTEYGKLSRFHYLAGAPGPVAKCFGLYVPSPWRLSDEPQLAGIIVYSLPPLNSRARDRATRFRYRPQKNVRARAARINRDFRTISRVIVHPQFRSLGLAEAMVRETLSLAGTRYVEAFAVMGHFHPFFQKAGMAPSSDGARSGVRPSGPPAYFLWRRSRGK
jgi:ribosomal protein S18 acetylase RimI-like enzyme